jgi:parafibromin
MATIGTATSTDPTILDPLLSLRRAIASQSLPVSTTSADLPSLNEDGSSSSGNTTDNLALATHLYFTQPIPQTIPLNAPTRFVSTTTGDNTPVNLRSIFFAWQKKDVAIPEYIASAQELNEALQQRGQEGDQVQNLVFVERLDLITWLEGASDESEYITPLETLDTTGAIVGAGVAAAGTAVAGAVGVQLPGQAAAASAQIVASGAGVPIVPSGAVSASLTHAGPGGRLTKLVDPRLQEIYNGERKMGDRNTVLRGIKATVSSFSML